MTYEEYRRKVDIIISARIGVGLDDLADCPLRDFFDDGLSPKEAAQEALEFDTDGASELLGW